MARYQELHECLARYQELYECLARYQELHECLASYQEFYECLASYQEFYECYLQDAGEYSCEAENKMGVIRSRKATLTAPCEYLTLVLFIFIYFHLFYCNLFVFSLNTDFLSF